MTDLKNFSDDDLISISALAHFSYCPRRCALIHVEQVWSENLFTAEGRVMHEKVHDEGCEARGGTRIATAVQLRCLKLGLFGIADVVEFRKVDEVNWRPYPVEYKRGTPRHEHCYEVQLCAQAMCLEEMLDCSVPEGALFYGRTRRRSVVTFDEALRRETERTAWQVRDLLNSGLTPPPKYAKHCESCSLFEQCLPKNSGRKGSVERYLLGMMVSEP